MLVNCQGIVFKSYKFQDTSLIVKIFTSSHGVQTFMVKGIRSVKANGKASLFQPGVLLDMIMYYQENKNFKGLREYRASHLYSSSLFDIRKSSVLIFLMEIIELCIHGEESNDAMFDFVYSALVRLDKEEFRA
ncbi:MAG: DNA repair protein RecO, partial [Bacteroidetes bacterium]|nr:DNA repair protein RecO [Bacteroidota bacterium]